MKDSDYWSYAKNELFKKINGCSFAFESDPSGMLLGGAMSLQLLGTGLTLANYIFR